MCENFEDRSSSAGSRALSILFGAPLAAVGAIALLPSTAIGFLGEALRKSSHRLFRKLDGHSLDYVNALMVVLSCLGGDPDRHLREVVCLEEAVLDQFHALTEAFGGSVDALLNPSASTSPIADIIAVLDVWKGRQLEWHKEQETALDMLDLPDSDQVADAREWHAGQLHGSPARPARHTTDAATDTAAINPGKISLGMWPDTKGSTAKSNALRELVAKQVYVTAKLQPLRQAITKTMYVMFVGVHNAGKSRFIKELWGFDTHPDALRRTESVNIYKPDVERLCARIHKDVVPAGSFSLSVIDTPGASDERQGVAEMWKTFADIATCYVCVFRAGHIAAPERKIVAEVQRTRRPFVVLINTTPSQEKALRQAGDGTMTHAYTTYAQSLGVHTTELDFVDAADPVKVEIVRRQLWAVLQPLVYPLEEATRHLAFSMCHKDLVMDLMPEINEVWGQASDEVATLLTNAVDERGPISAAQVRSGIRQRQAVNQDLSPILQGVGVLGRHTVIPLTKTYDVNLLEGILVGTARLRQANAGEELAAGAKELRGLLLAQYAEALGSKFEESIGMVDSLSAVVALRCAVTPVANSLSLPHTEGLADPELTGDAEVDFRAIVGVLAAELTATAVMLAQSHDVSLPSARLVVANLVARGGFNKAEITVALEKLHLAELSSDPRSDGQGLEHFGAFIEDAERAKKRLLDQSVFLTDR
jgi:hypothetical protein